MFGRSRPVTFDPYSRRRQRRGPPRWLVLLASGIAVGAAGIVYVQERWLPPRLTAEASTRLQAAFEKADAERTRLEAQLAEANRRLEATQGEREGLAKQLAASRDTTAELRADVAALVDALPPDPRGGTVGVRAARFAVQGTSLVYDVVLSRDHPGTQPLAGVMQLVVAGAGAKGPESSVALKPVPISVGRYDSIRGSQPLPEGFKPRQTTVQVLDKAGGKVLGMRVLTVGGK